MPELSLQDILTIAASAIAIASVIVRLTPTPKDDAVLAKVRKFFEALALTPPDRRR